MTRRSLRFRLLLAAAISISLALLAAGAALTALFERHVTRHLEGQLDAVLGQILAHIETAPDGRIRLDLHLADPRFDIPLSGLYWQIQDEDRHTLLRSRSLWDQLLGLPGDALPDGGLHRHRLDGPGGEPLLVLERSVVFRPGAEARPVRAAVALDGREILEARQAFVTDLLPYLAVLGAVLVLAAWAQVQVGLAPLEALRRGVRAIRAGKARRLPAERPDELKPLVEEVNALLDAQDGAIERARAWTADLAHGLKTPLVVLAADAERLRGLGQTAIAEDLERLAETMRRRVDRELIRARVRARLSALGRPGPGADERRASAGGPADLGETLESLIRALGRTPKGRTLDWELDCPAGVSVAMAPEDLAELLGNLLENASTWARRAVAVQAQGAGQIAVRIEDDGPGVPEADLPALGQRGLRLDRGTQGSGLGLAIARDICDAYGAQLAFGRALLGGLAASLRLPAAQTAERGALSRPEPVSE